MLSHLHTGLSIWLEVLLAFLRIAAFSNWDADDEVDEVAPVSISPIYCIHSIDWIVLDM